MVHPVTERVHVAAGRDDRGGTGGSNRRRGDAAKFPGQRGDSYGEPTGKREGALVANMVGEVLTQTRDWVVGHRETELPKVSVKPTVVGKWLLDEWALQAEMAYNRLRWPSPDFRRRLRTELGEAVELFNERGWVDDPKSYHAEPPALIDVKLRSRKSVASASSTSLSQRLRATRG